MLSVDKKETSRKYCSVPFKAHKRKQAKDLCDISANMLRDHPSELKPHDKRCFTCRKRILKLSPQKKNSSSEETIDDKSEEEVVEADAEVDLQNQ